MQTIDDDWLIKGGWYIVHCGGVFKGKALGQNVKTGYYTCALHNGARDLIIFIHMQGNLNKKKLLAN